MSIKEERDRLLKRLNSLRTAVTVMLLKGNYDLKAFLLMVVFLMSQLASVL